MMLQMMFSRQGTSLRRIAHGAGLAAFMLAMAAAGDAGAQRSRVQGKLVGTVGEPGGFVGQLVRVHSVGLRWIRRWAN